MKPKRVNQQLPYSDPIHSPIDLSRFNAVLTAIAVVVASIPNNTLAWEKNSVSNPANYAPPAAVLPPPADPTNSILDTETPENSEAGPRQKDFNAEYYSKENERPIPAEWQALLDADVVEDPRFIAVTAFSWSTPGQEATATAMTRLATKALAAHPRFRILTHEDVAKAVTNAPLFADRMDLARRNLAEGIRLYKVMRLADAMEYIGKALDLMKLIAAEWGPRDEVVKAHMYMALAALESGMAPTAHLHFKRLLALRPSFRFRKGYVSAAAQAAFEFALKDVLSSGIPDPDIETANKLSALCRADYLLLGRIKTRAEVGNFLVLNLFDASNNRFMDGEILPIDDIETDNDERIDRAISRLVACIPNREEITKHQELEPTSDNGIVIDTAFDSAVFFRSFTRNPLPNYGVSLGASYHINKNLITVARAALMASGVDRPHKDIRGTMNTFRVLAGFGVITEPLQGLEFLLTPGIDLMVPSSVVYTHDAQCKYDPAANPDCTSRLNLHNPGLLVGTHTGLEARWSFLSSFQAKISIGFSYYFLSLNNNDLNIPFDATLGIGYIL